MIFDAIFGRRTDTWDRLQQSAAEAKTKALEARVSENDRWIGSGLVAAGTVAMFSVAMTVPSRVGAFLSGMCCTFTLFCVWGAWDDWKEYWARRAALGSERERP